MDLNLQDFVRQLMASHSPNKELSPEIRIAICSLAAAGYSVRSLAELFGVSRHAIRHAVELWKSNKTFESRPRNGRPEALTPAEKRHILLMAKRDQNMTRKDLINATGKKVSLSTIRRCLRAQKTDADGSKRKK